MIFENIGYILLALMGLSLLVFIHEFGHYIAARRSGMRVEIFSIGFGKPIWSTMRDGVKWQVGILPFGGFVKIAGMEREKGKDPHDIPDGFYGKGPLARIKVALAGPIVNIVFALLAFTLLWMAGGRMKPFSEYTQYIGAVDPKSELYTRGIRPGDQVTELNGEPYTGIRDLLYTSLINGRSVSVEGRKIDYFKGQKTPFEYTLDPYPHPNSVIPEMTTIGIRAPAEYLIYEKQINNRQNLLYPGTPMFDSGIQYGDRIVWIDGELVFSRAELSRIVNEQKALLTIERKGATFLAKVPRVPISDIRLTLPERDEFEDWAYETALQGKISEKYFIPYNLTHSLVVERPYTFINEASLPFTYGESTSPSAPLEVVLEPGDRIVAIDGKPVAQAYDFFQEVQTKHVEIIVDRGSPIAPVSWKEGDEAFEEGVKWKELLPLIQTFGLRDATLENGRFHRLRAVTPIRYSDFPFTGDKRAHIAARYDNQLKAISEIKDVKERSRALELFERQQSRLMLGIELHDRRVRYNPNPLRLAAGVFAEMKRTAVGLFSGDVSPKYLSGPVGIVSAIQQNWLRDGFREALFWLGVISLNLGILNLLPIPVLDGGHICFSLIEAIRKKPLKPKTMERLIIPFVVLIVAFFLYITFHDIARLFGRFF